MTIRPGGPRRLSAAIVAASVGIVGGCAANVYRTGDPGVEAPTLVEEAKPRYTAEAMRARVTGSVELRAVVEPDGRVRDVEVVRSLDSEHGLDDAAVAALRGWRFTPGTRDGEPVPVRIDVTMSYGLR